MQAPIPLAQPIIKSKYKSPKMPEADDELISLGFRNLAFCICSTIVELALNLKDGLEVLNLIHLGTYIIIGFGSLSYLSRKDDKTKSDGFQYALEFPQQLLSISGVLLPSIFVYTRNLLHNIILQTD